MACISSKKMIVHIKLPPGRSDEESQKVFVQDLNEFAKRKLNARLKRSGMKSVDEDTQCDQEEDQEEKDDEKVDVSIKALKIAACTWAFSRGCKDACNPGNFFLKRECKGECNELCWLKDEDVSASLALGYECLMLKGKPLELVLARAKDCPPPSIKVKIHGFVEKDGVTWYKVRVASGKLEWDLERRYSEFYKLHKYLMTDDNVSEHIKRGKREAEARGKALERKNDEDDNCRLHLPPKERFRLHSNSKRVTEKRKAELEAYMKALLNLNVVRENPPCELLVFLGILQGENNLDKGAVSGTRRIHISRVEEFCNPGDVVLFKSMNIGAGLQRGFTHSKWDHAAIVVQRKSSYRLELVEAVGSDGVICLPLVSRLTQYSKGFAEKVGIRRLQQKCSPGSWRAFTKYIDHVVGKPYELSISKLVFSFGAGAGAGASAGAVVPTKSVEREQQDASIIDFSGKDCVDVDASRRQLARRRSSLNLSTMENFFCSELVAEALRIIKVLPYEHQANMYWPRSFQRGGRVDKAAPNALEAPVLVDFDELEVSKSRLRNFLN